MVILAEEPRLGARTEPKGKKQAGPEYLSPCFLTGQLILPAFSRPCCHNWGYGVILTATPSPPGWTVPGNRNPKPTIVDLAGSLSQL